MAEKVEALLDTGKFPSPCGVKVVANEDPNYGVTVKGDLVSVPLRGKGCG